MMAWVMPKHVFEKLYRELKIFVNTVILTKLWQKLLCIFWLFDKDWVIMRWKENAVFSWTDEDYCR